MTLLSFFGINQIPDFILGDEVNSDTSQVIAIYNNAVKKSDTSSPEGEYYYNFIDVTSDNKDLESIYKTIFRSAFNGEKTENYDVPGEGLLKTDDVKSAKCSTKDGKTTVIIEVKDHSDTVNTNPEDNPIARAMGATVDVNNFANLLPFKIESGLESLEIKYTDCKISCIIDDSTGIILYGEWKYTITYNFGNLVMNINGTPISLSNSSATIEYVVEI
jgi:hypothetical protein